MARTKQTAKKSSGGKAPRAEITSPRRQICAQQAKAQQIKESIKNTARGKAPTIVIPPMKRAPATTLQLSGPMVIDYATFDARLTYISFVSYARMVDSCTSATTALALCVQDVYGSQKHTGRW